MENLCRRSAEAGLPASSCRPPVSARRLCGSAHRCLSVCPSVSAGRQWCEAAALQSSLMQEPWTPVRLPSSAPTEAFRISMTTAAENHEGCGMKKPILQWPAAGNWDWERAGHLVQGAWLIFNFLSISLSCVTFLWSKSHSSKWSLMQWRNFRFSTDYKTGCKVFNNFDI